MPRVMICIYCYKKIDDKEEEFTLVGEEKDGNFAHAECFQNYLKGIDEDPVPPAGY